MIPKSLPSELSGQILLADPSLHDGTFNKAVVLLAEHSEEEGAFGLILNHPAKQRVGNLLSAPEFKELADIEVHFGGPVGKNNLTFAAFWNEPSGIEYSLRISAEEAIKNSRRPGTLVRAFVGYSGWSANQLEGELEQCSWIVTEPREDLLLQDHDLGLWREIMGGISPYHRILTLAPEQVLAN